MANCTKPSSMGFLLEGDTVTIFSFIDLIILHTVGNEQEICQVAEFTDVAWNVTVFGSTFRVLPCGSRTLSVTFPMLKVYPSSSPLCKVIYECGEIIGMQRTRSKTECERCVCVCVREM